MRFVCFLLVSQRLCALLSSLTYVKISVQKIRRLGNRETLSVSKKGVSCLYRFLIEQISPFQHSSDLHAKIVRYLSRSGMVYSSPCTEGWDVSVCPYRGTKITINSSVEKIRDPNKFSGFRKKASPGFMQQLTSKSRGAPRAHKICVLQIYPNKGLFASS